jgi:hypothetical protein
MAYAGMGMAEIGVLAGFRRGQEEHVNCLVIPSKPEVPDVTPEYFKTHAMPFSD